jgi:peptide/nickel transport system substrate-binding protein
VVLRRRVAPAINLPDRIVAGILSIALVALSVAALAPSLNSSENSVEPTPGAPPPPGYVEGVLGQATNASPFGARSAADRALVALLFRGLVRLGPDSTIVGDLASRWEVSDAGGTWTFHLRPDLFWQDGVAITADDVVFTVSVLSDPTYTGPGAASWRDVSAVALDPQTVALHLTTPLGGFLQAATQPIAPAHLLAGVPPESLPDDPFGAQPIGSGPYRLSFLEAGRAMLAAATPVEPPTGPGGPNFVTPRPTDSLATAAPSARAEAALPYIATFELRYFEDLETLTDAWQGGELDAVSGVQPADIAALQEAAPGRVVRYPGTTLLAATLDLRPARGEFQDPKVRKALLEAIDRDAIVRDVLHGFGSRADSLIPATSPMFDAAANPKLPFSAATARKDLTDAGWVAGNVGWTPKGAKEPLVIELLSPEESANPVAYETAKLVVDAWHDIGLAVRHVPLPASDLLEDRLGTGEFQVALVPLAIGLDPDLYPLLASSQTRTGGSNVAGLQDPELDTLLVAARTPVDDAARRTAYAALEKRLAERSYVLPLAFRDDYVVFRETVSGPESRPIATSGDRYWDVLTWRLADGN